jgi:hypothetical protein
MTSNYFLEQKTDKQTENSMLHLSSIIREQSYGFSSKRISTENTHHIGGLIKNGNGCCNNSIRSHMPITHNSDASNFRNIDTNGNILKWKIW